MRNSILTLLAMVLTAGMFTSCGDAAAGKSPEEVVVAFTNAVAEMDFRTAKKYASAGSQETLDALAGMATMAAGSLTDEQRAEMEEAKISVGDVNCTVDGESCSCSASKAGDSEMLNLVNEGGAWKVDFSKEGMGLGE
ncbi:MAG: hypothetical protein AAF433_00965 [Bacteroidota bacterium]